MNAIEELLSGPIGQGLSDDGTVFGRCMGRLRDVFAELPDPRTGKNKHFSMLELAGSAFSVFFTQCPSFLAYQRTMEDARGQSNARTVFGLERIPTDNCIRKTLDAVPPSALHPAFDALRGEFRRERKRRFVSAEGAGAGEKPFGRGLILRLSAVRKADLLERHRLAEDYRGPA